MPIRPENRKRYPPNWRDICAWVRQRSGGRCECRGECGRTECHLDVDGRCMNREGEPAWLTFVKVILAAAHLDHTPENCDLNNLRDYCQACHLNYDKHHRAATARRTRRERKATGDLFPQEHVHA